MRKCNKLRGVYNVKTFGTTQLIMQLKLHSMEIHLFQLYQLHSGYYQELIKLSECFRLNDDRDE